MILYSQTNGVLLEDILNLDEMGVQVIPPRSLAIRGSKQVGSAKKAVAQITKTSLCNVKGEMLGFQLIFSGKTDAVHPKNVKLPSNCLFSHSPSHFANVTTLAEFINHTIISYIIATRKWRVDAGASTQEEEDMRWAVLVMDNFSVHRDESIQALLRQHRIDPKCVSTSLSNQSYQ